VPDALLGDVMGDLNSRRGRVLGSESNGDGSCVVIAEVPTSEVLRYAIDLRSITGGRGTFRVEHDHYDPVPPNLVDRLVASTA
jgi:elongation factor G